MTAHRHDGRHGVGAARGEAEAVRQQLRAEEVVQNGEQRAAVPDRAVPGEWGESHVLWAALVPGVGHAPAVHDLPDDVPQCLPWTQGPRHTEAKALRLSRMLHIR
jgi:hypothetical protein